MGGGKLEKVGWRAGLRPEARMGDCVGLWMFFGCVCWGGGISFPGRVPRHLLVGNAAWLRCGAVMGWDGLGWVGLM